MLWASLTSSSNEHVAVLGDNTAALQSALDLKGRGPLLAAAREISWRQALYGWSFSVGHLPSEANTVADALSRIHSPEPARFPGILRSVPQAQFPDQAELWRAA